MAAGAGLSQGNCDPIRLLGQVRWLLSCLCQTSEGLRRTGDQREPLLLPWVRAGPQCDAWPPVLCALTRELGFNVDFFLQSSLRISPPLPFLPLSGVSRDPLKMGVGSRLDQDQAALAAVTSSPASASKRWPGASAWPSWDLLDSPEDPFSIEREARLHRQAAGKLDGGSQQASVCPVLLGGYIGDLCADNVAGHEFAGD